jgi:hypothetical protein
MGYP